MIREGLTKFNINRTNTHLKDIYSSSYYVELGTIDYDIISRLLHYEMISLDDITYLPIQNRGIGKSNVNNNQLNNIVPFLFFDNVYQKNKSLQLFITYGLLRFKNEINREVFSPIVLIPINLYFDKDKIFIQQISRPIENSVLINYLSDIKNINIVISDKLDSIYSIDKFCMNFEKFDSLKLELENFLTFASLKEQEIKINHDKFNNIKNYDDYLYDKLYTQEIVPIYYSAILNRMQRYVVHSAYSGNNIVVSGRIGTGKTTVLSNIAINAINKGKRVLYVSNMKETLDYIYHQFETIGMNQYVTNFSNSFASFHQGELINNCNIINNNESNIDSLFENYKFINDYENLITKRILDFRFIDIINELATISDLNKKIIDIGDLSNLYKSEYYSTLKALDQIYQSLNKINSFQNSIWRDIPIYNNIKYPNQIFSMIYQVQKGFLKLEEEKHILENEFGFKPITNYAYLKNVIHNYKNLNIEDVPNSWVYNNAYDEAKEEYRNLKSEILQLQEYEYALNFKYDKIDSIDIKNELNSILGDFFTKDDSYKIDRLNQDRVDLIVKTNKITLQIDIFKKSISKIGHLMNWEFNIRNYIIDELIKLGNNLLDVKFNNIFINAILENKYDLIYDEAYSYQTLIEQYREEKNTLFKNSPINSIGSLESSIESIEKYNNEKPVKRSAYRLITNLKENHPNDFSTIIKNVKHFRELSDRITNLENKFFQLTGYEYNNNILNDFKKLNEYLNGIEGLTKDKVIKFLDRITTPRYVNSKANKNYQKVFDLLLSSYTKINELYDDLIEYQFTNYKEEFIDKINDLLKISSYLQNAFLSNDRILSLTKNPTEKYVKAEEYFHIYDNIEKIKQVKESFKNNKKYQYLYQNLYREHLTNLNNIARLLQSYRIYSDCFIDNYSLIRSYNFASQINEQLNICSEVSDNLNEVFKLYFKIFKESVSRYYYNDFQSNLTYLSELLNSKDELIVYLSITDNLKTLYKYNLDKLVTYIINLKTTDNFVLDFKYTYLLTLKKIYIGKYPSLNNHNTLEECLANVVQEEKKVILDIENQTLKNIKKNSGLRYSVFGLRNLDYNSYIRRTNGIKSLFLSTTQILNNFLNIKNFDLVIIDDAHLLSANEYYVAIHGAQVVIAGELQLQSATSNNLISRMRSSKNINFDFRFTPTPKSLLKSMEGQRGIFYNNYYDNYGIEIINENLLETITQLISDNNDCIINLFISTIDKQRSVYEDLINIFIDQGLSNNDIIDIFTKNINISDLSLGYLFNADFNILMLEDYFNVDAEYLVVNMIDNILLCKKKLYIYDNNNYLKERKGPRFLLELKRIVNAKHIFNKPIVFGLLENLVNHFEQAKLTVYESVNFNLLIRKKSKLYGILIFWDDNKNNYDLLNDYREKYMINDTFNFKVFIIWSMDLINSIDAVCERIIEEIKND